MLKLETLISSDAFEYPLLEMELLAFLCPSLLTMQSLAFWFLII